MTSTQADRGCTIPALSGREPLGFLAALGLVRLMVSEDWRLSWDPMTAQAQVHGPASVGAARDGVVAQLTGMRDDELLPGLPASMLPPRASDSGPDPARIDIPDLGQKSSDFPRAPGSGWVTSIWTDLADDDKGRCARTPFNAPAGKQTFSRMFVKARGIVLDDPDRWIGEALEGWVRREEFTGEGFDSRALRDAAELPDRKPSMYGVPGATFLALAAVPFFRVSGAGSLSRGESKRAFRSRRNTVSWYRPPVGTHRRRNVFAWPLWTAPLDEAAIHCVLDHPEVHRAVPLALGADELQRRPSLAPLGVWAIGIASRRQSAAGKSEGVLTAERLWRPR